MRQINLLLSLLLFLVLPPFAKAADIEYKDYDWVENPKVHALTDEEKELSEVSLKDKRVVEYAYESNGELAEYFLSHTIKRVNSDKAIQQNNKIYIPSGNIDYLKHKVRVINPDGKVKELSDSDIKEAVDEKTKVKYRFFALEGIVMGSEIEHLFIMKLNPNYTGARETLQSDVLKKDVEFELFAPVNLAFKIKSYNGLPEVAQDTTREDKNVYRLKLETIEALEEEETAAYTASLMQLVYKLDANLATGAKDIISYGAVANNIFKNICNSAEKKEKKQVKKLISKIDTKLARDEEDKIRMIEHYLKVNYMIIDNANPAISTIEGVLENKVANEGSIVKLYSEIFNQLDIEYEIVLTTDRSKMKFDPSFEAYNFLTDYLIYIPSVDKYLCPSDQGSCFGYVPFNFSNNYGLFIRKISLNDYQSGVGEIKFIEPVAYDKNYSNLFVKVDFSESVTKPTIHHENHMNGYYAQYYQPYYDLMGEDDKKKINEAIVNNFLQNAEIKELSVENEGRDYFGVRPFIIKSTLSSESIVEKAGNRFLFKAGDLIGPQMEMYQDEERKLEVENDFTRLYNREITFTLPEGYKISNPEILEMDVYKEEDGERIISFKSTYTIEGNTYTIKVKEYYKKLNFPVSEYEDYRKVINAAADFNKITLVIEKI